MGQIKNECFSCGQGNFTVVAVMSVVPGIIVLVNLVVGVQGTPLIDRRQRRYAPRVLRWCRALAVLAS
jgi:hypothetical protein